MGFADELEEADAGQGGRRCQVAEIAEALGDPDGVEFLAAVEDPTVATGRIRLALRRRIDPDRHADAADVAARLEPLDLGHETIGIGVVLLRSQRSLTRHRNRKCRCRP